jgi:NADH:ubiquinone oxidoreductase subunit K
MTTPMRRLFEQLVSAFFLLTIVRKFKSRSSLMKIRAAQVYVLGVKKTRLFFLGVLFVLVSFVFLINGLSLIQTAFFNYSMWSTEVKFIVALLLGGIEFFVATGILIYLFREETWGKFSGIRKVLNSVVEGKSGNKNERDQEGE